MVLAHVSSKLSAKLSLLTMVKDANKYRISNLSFAAFSRMPLRVPFVSLFDKQCTSRRKTRF